MLIASSGCSKLPYRFDLSGPRSSWASFSLRRTFRSAYGASAPVKRVIVVRLEDAEGVVGWGEAPVFERPFFGVDTAESTWSALVDLILPAVVGHDFGGPAEVAAASADFLGQNYAKCAVESAVWAIASDG